MHERVVTILRRFRRRVLAARAAEAAAVGGAGGALVAAVLMAARILARVYPYLTAGLCAAPLAGGIVLAAWPRARRSLGPKPLLQWYVVALLAVCGAAGLACAVSGALLAVPKNWLLLIAPAGGALAAAAVLARGASTQAVAMLVDRRAGLREKLSTAWELQQVGGQSPFARAVQDQAAAAAGDDGLARLRFWDRTPATLGALGLALAAAALMLPWSELESPAARRRRHWQRVAPPVAELLQRELDALNAADIEPGTDLSGQLRRLEGLTRLLRSARAEEARQWRGTVVEMDEIAEALRRIVRSGREDAATNSRIIRLLRAIEQAAAEVAEGMAQADGADYARPDSRGIDPAGVTPPTPGEPAPAGWTTVFNPDYAALVKPATGTAPAGGAEVPTPPQLPYDRQWFAARARASGALTRGEIPPEYRQLVRDFFVSGEAPP